MKKTLATLAVSGALVGGAVAPLGSQAMTYWQMDGEVPCILFAHLGETVQMSSATGTVSRIIKDSEYGTWVAPSCVGKTSGTVNVASYRKRNGSLAFFERSNVLRDKINTMRSGADFVPQETEAVSLLDLITLKAHAAIAVNSLEATNTGHTCNACTSLSWTFTNTAGTTLILCSATNDNLVTVNSATYAGSALNLDAFWNNSGTAPTVDLRGWHGSNPSTGGNTLAVGSSGSTQLHAGGSSFTGATTAGDKTDVGDMASSTSAVDPLDISIVTTQANEVLTDCYNGNGLSTAAPAVSGGTNVLSYNLHSGREMMSSYLITTTAGTYHLKWTNTDTNAFARIVWGIKAATVVVASTPGDDDAYNAFRP